VRGVPVAPAPAFGDDYTGVVTVPGLAATDSAASEETDDFNFPCRTVAFHAASMYHGYECVVGGVSGHAQQQSYLAEEEARSLLDSYGAELHNRRKGERCGWRSRRNADPEIIDACAACSNWSPWQVFSVTAGESFAIVHVMSRPASGAEVQISSARAGGLRQIARLVENCGGTTCSCIILTIRTMR